MNVQVSARVPKEIRDEAEKVANHYGLTASDIVKMTLTVVANEHRVPIDMNRTSETRNKPYNLPVVELPVVNGHSVWPKELDFSGDDEYEKLI